MGIDKSGRFCSLEDVANFAKEAKPAELCESLSSLASQYGNTSKRSIELVAAHGLPSPQARSLVATASIDKICPPGFTGFPGVRSHTGALFVDQMETIAIELAKRLFGVRYVELRPQSCALSNEVVLAALAGRGHTILAQSGFNGADPSTRELWYGGYLGFNYIDLPFDESGYAVDLDKTATIISTKKPRLIVIGSGYIRFPYPVRELREMADKIGSKIHYDGAHAVGLIAGGQYQDPIDEGAHAVTGSTQKTLCGPIGGIILTNHEEVALAVRQATDRLIGSYLNHHIAALAVTFAEMLEFGSKYSRNVVQNAQALAESLDEEGLIVLGKEYGYTKTHIVLFDVETDEDDAVRWLEQAGIFVTHKPKGKAPACSGIRLGTASVTRRGMGCKEMKQIATLIRRIVLDKEIPARVAADVTDLASNFNDIHYCFRQ